MGIDSQPGQGTTITLGLPLTVAIIDGLLVQLDNRSFVIPLSVVQEVMNLEQARSVARTNRNILDVRGKIIPYLNLREVFEMNTRTVDDAPVIIVRGNNMRYGLVVDRVVGQQQVFIKNIGKIHDQVGVLSAATILGDGSIAMILDPSQLAIAAENDEKQLLIS